MSDEAPQGSTPTPGHGPDLMSTPSLLALAVVAFVVELATMKIVARQTGGLSAIYAKLDAL